MKNADRVIKFAVTREQAVHLLAVHHCRDVEEKRETAPLAGVCFSADRYGDDNHVSTVATDGKILCECTAEMQRPVDAHRFRPQVVPAAAVAAFEKLAKLPRSEAKAAKAAKEGFIFSFDLSKKQVSAAREDGTSSDAFPLLACEPYPLSALSIFNRNLSKPLEKRPWNGEVCINPSLLHRLAQALNVNERTSFSLDISQGAGRFVVVERLPRTFCVEHRAGIMPVSVPR